MPSLLDEFMRLQEAGQLLEIWNLVFMQYDLQKDGSKLPLPAPSVDTGAGLERIAGVLQGVPSNFDTDLFTPIIERAVEVVGKKYDRGPEGASYRVLADHARAVAFLLADGVYPSNEGRGYVVRRILRRAVRHAWLLGRREPTLVHLVPTVEGLMGSTYPDLVAKRAAIEKAIHGEEERFFDTIEGGLTRLDDLKSAKVISGDEAFKLYDTFGFPIDLTEIIATERGQTVDLAGFERALEGQRDRSRSAEKSDAGAPAVHAKRTGEWRTVKPQGAQKWVGYDTTAAETDVLKFRQSDDRVEVVLEQNPFYLESGGQVSDTGTGDGEGVDARRGRRREGGRGERGRWPLRSASSSPRRCSRRWTSCGGRTSSATTRRRTWCTRRSAGSSGPTCANRDRWWPPTGCASTSRITGRSTTRRWRASKKRSTRTCGRTFRSRRAR